MKLFFITSSAVEILKANKQKLDHLTDQEKNEKISVLVYKTTMAKWEVC